MCSLELAPAGRKTLFVDLKSSVAAKWLLLHIHYTPSWQAGAASDKPRQGETGASQIGNIFMPETQLSVKRSQSLEMAYRYFATDVTGQETCEFSDAAFS